MKIDKDTIARAAKGDAHSMQLVLDQYTPLVHKTVNKYAFMAPRHSKEDLVQEGFIGLVNAVRGYDPAYKTCFMTFAFPSVRMAVQRVARKENRNPKYPLSLEQSDWGANLEDPCVFEVQDEVAAEKVREIVLAGCGSLTSKKAQMICDRFGLLGHEPMRQGEVAKKYNMTKQAVQSHMARFHRKVRAAYPELQGFV